jgi:hypothetical protein
MHAVALAPGLALTPSSLSSCLWTAHEHRTIFSDEGMRSALRMRTQGFLITSNAYEQTRSTLWTVIEPLACGKR